MPSNATRFKRRLTKATGLSGSAIAAAWPEWWSDDADASPSAQAELRFSIARKLGLDPRSLIDEAGAPHFIWDDSAKYKNFSGDMAHERPAITSFGTSVSRLLIQGTPNYRSAVGISAATLRKNLLSSSRPFVRLQDLLALTWGLGIPTIHLRIHPLSAKRMCAMSVNIGGGRAAILLAKDSQYPPLATFHLAHEIAHIALGHVEEGGCVVDMEDPAAQLDREDEEEVAADQYALELLTGDSHFMVSKEGQGNHPMELAKECLREGRDHRIEPGTLALCYAHATGEWAVAQKALSYIYIEKIPVWSVVNKIAARELDWSCLSDENASFLHAIMGGE